MLNVIIVAIVAAVAFGVTCAIIGAIVSLVGNFQYRNWKPISTFVYSSSTGHKYHADRYCLIDNHTPWIRIYNGQNGFQWYPIWHFKDPLLIMLIADPEYAKNNVLGLIGIQEQAENFTKTNI